MNNKAVIYDFMHQIRYKLLIVIKFVISCQQNLIKTHFPCRASISSHYLPTGSANNITLYSIDYIQFRLIQTIHIILPMLQRAWGFLNWLFGINCPPKNPVVNRVSTKQRFLILDDPFQKEDQNKKVHPKQRISKLPSNAAQLLNFYTLHLDKDYDKQRAQIQKSNNEFILEMRKTDEVIKKIEQTYDKIVNKDIEKCKEVSFSLERISAINQVEQTQRANYRKYTKYILNTIKLKYQKQLLDYPTLSFSQFKDVMDVWDKSSDSVVNGYTTLRYTHIKLLSFGQWLNDEVISQYINMINTELSKRQNNSWVLLNSLKVSTIFDKADYKKVQKILEKQKVSRDSILILAVHKVNHWIFLKMERQQIVVYDSMMKNSVSQYLSFPLIKKIVKFAEYYYQSEPQVKKPDNFPQQTNYSDCGMMMLCGMKDLVRNVRKWTFSQDDIPYRRILMTKEIIDKNIVGF